MKLLRITITTVFAAILFATPALADACSDKARAMVDGDPNTTLLSVKSKQGSNGKITCEARIKIASSSKPPRIVVKKFKP